MQIRVARPTRDLQAARRFYGEALGLPLVAREGEEPKPTEEDQLVLDLGSPAELEPKAARLRAAGFEPRVPANPYWERNGAVGFVDPDGYWLILSPEAWAEAR